MQNESSTRLNDPANKSIDSLKSGIIFKQPNPPADRERARQTSVSIQKCDAGSEARYKKHRRGKSLDHNRDKLSKSPNNELVEVNSPLFPIRLGRAFSTRVGSSKYKSSDAVSPERPPSLNFLSKLVTPRSKPVDISPDRMPSPIASPKSIRNFPSPTKSLASKSLEDFDWMEYESEEDASKVDQQNEVRDLLKGNPANLKPSCWRQLPAWIRRLAVLFMLVILSGVPAAIALGKNTDMIKDPAIELLKSELFLWSAFLEGSILGYHLLILLSKFILKSARLPGGIGTIFHVKQLFKWMRLVFACTAAFVTEATTLHSVMCGFTSSSCSWPGWWIRSVLAGLFVTSVLFFAEKVVLQRIAINFHQKQYAERIRKAKISENTLATLMHARKVRKRQLQRALLEAGGGRKSHFAHSPDLRGQAQLFGFHGDESPEKNIESGNSLFWRVGLKRPRGIIPSQRSANTCKLTESQMGIAERDDESYEEFSRVDLFNKNEDWTTFPSERNSTFQLCDAADNPQMLPEHNRGTSDHVASKSMLETEHAEAMPDNSHIPPLADISLITGMPDPSSFKVRMSRVGVNSKRDACRLARKIFVFLCPKGETEINKENLLPYLPDENVRENFLSQFDKDVNKNISRREFRDGIVAIHRERRNLSESLGHSETIVKQLDVVCLIVVSFVDVLIWLAIFSVNVYTFFVSVTSVVVASTFVIGSTAKSAFEALVLTFMVHPFDVGDKVTVDNEIMVVEHMSVLHSRFRRSDGQEVYYPNSILSSKVVANMRRSGDMWESLPFEIRSDLTLEQFLKLRSTVMDYIKRESADWTGKSEVMPQELLEGGTRLKIGVSVQGRGNWVDSGKRWSRKTRLFFFVLETIKKMDLKCLALPEAGASIDSTQQSSGPQANPGGLLASGALVPITTMVQAAGLIKG